MADSSTPEAAISSTSPVTAVIRSLQLLEAFGMSDAHLSLAELSRRTGLHKTTALRLARTLAAHQYLVQKSDVLSVESIMSSLRSVSSADLFSGLYTSAACLWSYPDK